MILEYRLSIKQPNNKKVTKTQKKFYTSLPFQIGECFQIPASGLLKKGEMYQPYKEEGFFRVVTIIRDVERSYDLELFDTKDNGELEKIYFDLVCEHFYIDDVYDVAAQ
jgi:hypothetical protein